MRTIAQILVADSASGYICTSGRVIARVQLRGSAVKLGKASAKKK